MLPSISLPAAASQQLPLTAPLVILALPIAFLPCLLLSPLPQLLPLAIMERLRRKKQTAQAAQAKVTAPVPSPVLVTIPVIAATSTDSVKAAYYRSMDTCCFSQCGFNDICFFQCLSDIKRKWIFIESSFQVWPMQLHQQLLKGLENTH